MTILPDNDGMPAAGRERVAADAASRGIPIEIIERPKANSLEEAAAILGVDPSVIVKSLVVKRHDGTFLFALVPGDRQISWAKPQRGWSAQPDGSRRGFGGCPWIVTSGASAGSSTRGIERSSACV